MGRVFVIGSINQDYVLAVHRRPGPGESVAGASLTIRPGGKGANQAVAAVEAGAAVILLARVGVDEAGMAQRHDLSARGVNISLVADTAGEATGSAFITVTPDGENAVTMAAGANDRVGMSDVDAAAVFISESAILVAQLEIPLDAVARAVTHCGPGTHVVLNAAPSRPLPAALLKRIDTLVVNEHEAASLTGLPVVGADAARTAADTIVGLGPRAAVVTLGIGGAVVTTAGNSTHVPAPTVPVVDTTGAGDVFVGTLAALLADGQSLERAVAVAVDRASASVAFVGARSPLTTG